MFAGENYSMRIYLTLSFIVSAFVMNAQTRISGTVTDERGKPVPGANVYIKDTYDGATVDANGSYQFITDTGNVQIVVSMMGFVPIEDSIRLSGAEQTYNATLKQMVNMINVVVISAGTIEASDEKRTTVLKPLDIVTNANSSGDIYGALQTLPGTQQVGESEGLFVRGGTGAETKTVIDGMVVNNPFFSTLPDIASRGRFSPFLFKGIVFSTGGYSAQYGQAMSSALVLETQDLPSESSGTLALSVVGVGGGYNHLAKSNKFSAGADVNYTNLTPYFSLVKQNVEWDKVPEYFGGSANFRLKTSSTGMLKFYGYNNYSRLALFRESLENPNEKNRFELKNANIYTNTTYRESFGDKWRIYLGASYSTNKDDINLDKRDTIQNINELTQGRAMLTRYIGTLSVLRVGGEYLYGYDRSAFNSFKKELYDNFTAGFAEADIYLSKKLVARVGGRVEHSTLLNSTNVAPRTSIAYKIGDFSQVSIAAGEFYQKPENLFLTPSTNLGYEKSRHYIANFQKVDEMRTFRIEAYHKTYHDLIKTFSTDTFNTGSGYARGIDVFLRDKKTIKLVDYWLSYSYLDTKRNFRNYPGFYTPHFASDHTASLVFKYFISKITTNVGFAYTYASGRPYYNPNNPEFLGDRTSGFHNLGINASYLTRIKGAFTVIALSVGNALGRENVFSYRYSRDGQRREPVIATANRSVFLGIFMSFGVDRRGEVNNN